MPTAQRALHIVKTAKDGYPWNLVAALESNGHAPTPVVLIQDAVSEKPPTANPVFVLEADATSRGVTSAFPLIDDQRLIELIWDADTVIVW